MVEYFIEGTCGFGNSPTGFTDLEGTLDVDVGGVFDSRMGPKHMKGYFHRGEDIRLLLLLSSNWIFDLSKEEEEKGLEGIYLGRWGELPYSVKFEREYGLFVAKIDEAKTDARFKDKGLARISVKK